MYAAKRILADRYWLAVAVAVSLVFGCGRHGTEPVESLKPGRTTAVAGASAEDALGWLETDAMRRRVAEEAAELDPRTDGWTSEHIAELAGARLHALEAILQRDSEVTATALTPLCHSAVTCSELRPAHLTTAFDDGVVTVRRADGAIGNSITVAPGVEALATALNRMLAAHGAVPPSSVHFKVIGIHVHPETAVTDVRVELASAGNHGRAGQTAAWACEWARDQDTLRLLSVRLVEFEEVTSASESPWFVDCTGSVLAQDDAAREQIAYGLDHWTRHIERTHRIDVYARYGLAVGDANGDGLEDLYLCQPGGLPNRLFIQRLEGAVEDQSQVAGVDWLDRTSSALFIDVDNDDDQDLLVATAAGILCMANDGRGRFQLQAELPLVDNDPHSLSAADYDDDGDLDIYVCVEFARLAGEGGRPPAFVYHDANDGGRNVLFRNDLRPSSGKWQFTDVTVEVGLDVDNRRHSLAAAWEDYDNDGDLDLYVANDYGRNCLYRNDGARFSNVAELAGVVDFGSGMSVSWSDVNRDGWMDLYVGNMFSSAGNRITNQSAFHAGSDANTRAIYRRFAKGNSLFTNQADGVFQEISNAARVEMARWAWSSLLVDINNDGWDDAIAANGYITGDDSGDL